MTQFEHRAFIALDEWFGFCVGLYILGRFGPWLAVPYFVTWAVMIYGLSYPPYWRQFNASPWRK